MTKIRTNLKIIFEQCEKRGILPILNESCCDTYIHLLSKYNKTKYIGYVFSYIQNID